METVKPQQMGLIGFVDDSIGRVFVPKVIKNKDGAEVGTNITVRARKDIAALIGKTNSKENKAAIDAVILGMSDAAYLKVKAEMAGLGPEWTLARASHRTTANGVRQISITVKEVKRNVGPSDEEVAKSLKCTVEEVRIIRKRQEDALAALENNTVNVPSETSTPNETPAPETPAAE